MGHILTDPFRVEACFVHAYQTDGREVVLESAQVMFGVRIETGMQKLGDDGTFDLQAERAAISISLVQTFKEICFIFSQISMRGIFRVTTPMDPVLSPLPKKPPVFLRSSLKSRRKRQHMLRTSLGSMSLLM
jgi:hypothetical protein